METPPEIVLRGVEMTPGLNALINDGLDRLEQVCSYIVSARVALDQAQGRHVRGNPYQMRIDVKIPGNTIMVKRSSHVLQKTNIRADESHSEASGEPDMPGPQTIRPGRAVRQEPLEALVRRAFDSAQRELRKAVDRQRKDIKTPAHGASAIVERILREEGYGFLRTLDGEQIYFHKNSVLHDHWDNLRVGTAVRCEAEVGEKGMQATTVEPLDRPGAEESHDRLHPLPVVAEPPSRRRRS